MRTSRKRSLEILTCSVLAWGRCITEIETYPNWQLPKIISDVGFELIPLSNRDADVLIVIDLTPSSITKVLKFRSRIRYLIALEPKSVSPLQHSRVASIIFSKVFKQSSEQLLHNNNEICSAGYLPDLAKINEELEKRKTFDQKKDGIVLANSLKFAFGPTSKYDFRLDAMRFFAQHASSLYVAGNGWHMHPTRQLPHVLRALVNDLAGFTIPRLTKIRLHNWARQPGISLLGWVEDEIEVFRNYRFVLAIENDFSYVSEKFFNPILAGSLPIYAGGASTLDVPKSAFLDLLDEGPKSVLLKLKTMTEGEYAERIEAGREWVSRSSTLERWNQNEAFRLTMSKVHDESSKTLDQRK